MENVKSVPVANNAKYWLIMKETDRKGFTKRASFLKEEHDFYSAEQLDRVGRKVYSIVQLDEVMESSNKRENYVNFVISYNESKKVVIGIVDIKDNGDTPMFNRGNISVCNVLIQFIPTDTDSNLARAAYYDIDTKEVKIGIKTVNYFGNMYNTSSMEVFTNAVISADSVVYDTVKKEMVADDGIEYTVYKPIVELVENGIIDKTTFDLETADLSSEQTCEIECKAGRLKELRLRNIKQSANKLFKARTKILSTANDLGRGVKVTDSLIIAPTKEASVISRQTCDASKIKTLTIPNGAVITAGAFAFSYKLREVNSGFGGFIANNKICFRMLGAGAFQFTELTNIELEYMSDKDCKYGAVEERAFQYCRRLKSLFTANISIIDSKAFFGCYELKKVTFDSSINIIKAEAFKGCSKLKSVRVPIGAMIENGAFEPCTEIIYYRSK